MKQVPKDSAGRPTTDALPLRDAMAPRADEGDRQQDGVATPEAAAVVERVLGSTLVELRRAEQEAAMRAEQIELQLRLAARMWERDLLRMQERVSTERQERESEKRALGAQLVVTQAWLTHTLAALADQQRNDRVVRHQEGLHQNGFGEKQESNDESSFWEVLKWSKKGKRALSITKDEHETDRIMEMEKEVSRYRSENDRLRLMLKRNAQIARDWEEFSNREDAIEQIKSDKMVMTFLHSRVGELEKQLDMEKQNLQEAAKKAATAEAENGVLKKRVAELDKKVLAAMTANPGGQADVAQLTAHVHEKDLQLQALKQGYAQLKVKKDILVTEVKKLQNDTSRLGAENDRQKLDLQYFRSQEENFHKIANREEYEMTALLLEVDELRRALEDANLERINAKLVRERREAAEEEQRRAPQEHKIAEDLAAGEDEAEGHPRKEKEATKPSDTSPSPVELIERSNQHLEAIHAEIMRRKEELRTAAAAEDGEERGHEDEVAKRLAVDRQMKREMRERHLDLLALLCDLRIQLNAYSERLLALARHKQERLHNKFVWIE